jgi:hypothetical protein
MFSMKIDGATVPVSTNVLECKMALTLKGQSHERVCEIITSSVGVGPN